MTGDDEDFPTYHVLASDIRILKITLHRQRPI